MVKTRESALSVVLVVLGVLALWAARFGSASAQGQISVAVVADCRPSLTNAATDETIGEVIGPQDVTRVRESAYYIKWGTGVVSGVVQVESADDVNYAGTWAPLATVTFGGTAPKQDLVQIAGIHRALRTRISTVVAGGTVSTCYVGN